MVERIGVTDDGQIVAATRARERLVISR